METIQKLLKILLLAWWIILPFFLIIYEKYKRKESLLSNKEVNKSLVEWAAEDLAKIFNAISKSKRKKRPSINDHLKGQAKDSIDNRNNLDKNESPSKVNSRPEGRKGTERERSSLQPINKDTSDIIPSAKGSTKEASSSNKNKPSHPKRKINWPKLTETNTRTGAVGELIVLEFERQNLSEINSPHLNFIEHVSKTKGDYLGYDIKSFDDEGNPKFIEVKATTSDIDTRLFMTQNELKAMERYGDQYYLYIVYNLNVNEEIGDLAIFNGPDEIRKKFNFVVSTYKLKPQR